ncbi:MAG: UDP-N-acetylglucosamine 1-carboxyvinyltransferase [Alphaproteobacteria bacterium]|nr:UDP-N-acetylglucosamine 1-carboxyvinyltransferase [Alphaproteobacteria bacterium]MCL2505707.1 UDP-N-acetylglucosamine 1-carboxyvinyltransferase [Alphaproteobacteria bacterium]
MHKIRIQGGKALNGDIQVSGAKNAALPLLAASLLTDEELVLCNVPDLSDINTMIKLLTHLGVHVFREGRSTIRLKASNITNTTAIYDLVKQMRAGIGVLGPLLARCGEAKVSSPGGCAIGSRPIDLHIEAMKALGATIELDNGYIVAKAPPKGLKGAEIVFKFVTVMGTENALMAAVLAKGESVIINAAREPEVIDLAKCLVSMGADIEGIGTDKIKVKGKSKLHKAKHTVIADRIEAGTFAMVSAITGGSVRLIGAKLEHLNSVALTLAQVGMQLIEEDLSDGQKALKVQVQSPLKGVDITTKPYPGFPTDLQAQFMALMSVSEGASMIAETIFENRFMHVPELNRMGANITVQGSNALVRGTVCLTGAPVMATDLRASSSLVMAGLAAKGETVIDRVYHLDRGYENLVEKLSRIGADIQRIRDS